MPMWVQIAVLGCKSVIAVLLLAAGGAKLADRPGFASTVRLFGPSRFSRSSRASLLLASAIAAGELAAGALSLSVPQLRWPNFVVVVICVAFLGTWTFGFSRHRGRSCHCFGALSGRGFDRAGIARSAVLLLAALAASAPVPAQATQLGPGGQLALLAGGALIAVAAYSAAAAAGRGPARTSPRRA
jgi:hypothetical protein